MNNRKFYCSYCHKSINKEEKLRSIAIIGVLKITEYPICEDCILYLTSVLKDYSENKYLKRIPEYGYEFQNEEKITIQEYEDAFYKL